MFLITRPRSFWLKIKKKKNQCQIQTKIVESASPSAPGRDTCTLHLQRMLRLLRGGGKKTFSCCVVWWKAIGSTSKTIRYSKSMMVSIHAHSSKIWANFNAFLQWLKWQSSASLVTENQKPPWIQLKLPNMVSAESNEVLFDKTRVCVWFGIQNGLELHI